MSLLILLLAGCIHAPDLVAYLDQAETDIASARALHADVCAPEQLARAEAAARFTHIEFDDGDMQRAQDHAKDAAHWAAEAAAASDPCGTADADADGVIDLLDLCPNEPEDLDGIEDEDGCREISPTDDEDGDGIINIDDACVFEAEDIDGHNDTDGCPETSADMDGDGLIDAVDLCPAAAEDFDNFNDDDGCPELDNDRDGVNDTVDVCPTIPEDLDGWDDADGCPEADNDADGIPDADDRCPNQPGPRDRGGCPSLDGDGDGIADVNDQCPAAPETKNGYLDDDGCPDTEPTNVRVTKKQIELKESIHFASGRTEVLAESRPILDDIVKVLEDVPDMTLRIEGHTDSDGSEASNLALSQGRAESVMAYLVAHGIAASRLEAEGFGETRPIDTNRTPSGRLRNRRVDFQITSAP